MLRVNKVIPSKNTRPVQPKTKKISDRQTKPSDLVEKDVVDNKASIKHIDERV
mgnify:CR=1 FL=1